MFGATAISLIRDVNAELLDGGAGNVLFFDESAPRSTAATSAACAIPSVVRRLRAVRARLTSASSSTAAVVKAASLVTFAASWVRRSRIRRAGR